MYPRQTSSIYTTAFYSGDPYWTVNVTNYVTTFRPHLVVPRYQPQPSTLPLGPVCTNNLLNRDNVLPKQPQHAALPREHQRIRRTLHAHTVARYTSQGVALHHTLTPTTIRQSRGVSLLMARLLHALKGQGPPWISRTGMIPSPGNLFHSTTTRCQRYVKAYRLRKDSITRLEVRPSTFIT